jgi:hypothetical protein
MTILKYKRGVSDNAGVLIKENGTPKNLSGATVTFSMKKYGCEKITISCVDGGTVNGVTYSKAQGGVTIPFNSTHLAAVGKYKGEFFILIDGVPSIAPSDDENNIVVIITEAV